MHSHRRPRTTNSDRPAFVDIGRLVLNRALVYVEANGGLGAEQVGYIGWVLSGQVAPSCGERYCQGNDEAFSQSVRATPPAKKVRFMFERVAI